MYLKERQIKGNKYFYLIHSYRSQGGTKKIERYLGSEIPSNINDVRDELYDEFYRSHWYHKLDDVIAKYIQELINTPRSVQELNKHKFAIRFTYNSNRIEGNALKLRDTQLLLEENRSPADKKMRDVVETLSHHQVFKSMLEFNDRLDSDTVLKWHEDLLIETDPEVAGTLRKYNVQISGSNAIPPHHHEVPHQFENLIEWVQFNLKERSIHPVLFAALAHQKMATIHPFGDGNGRISRLLQNYILNSCDAPMLVIEYKNRRSYYNALERSNLKKDPHIFVLWFFRSFLKADQYYHDMQ